MTKAHWFDDLNTSLLDDANRRGLLRATGALLAAVAIADAASLAEARRKHRAAGNEASEARMGVGAQGRGKGGKRKHRGKPDDHKDGHGPDPSCDDVCRREFALHPEEIPACARKCEACRIRENFCVIEGDSNDPTMIATCCFEGDQCCQSTHACCPMDSICCPGYPQTSPKPCCATDETCCPSDDYGCCSRGLVCCPGEGCVRLASNQRNCGVCGNRCSDHQYCEGGQCVPVPVDACPGRTACGGNCVDTERDRSHCGRCNKVCRDGQECRNGRCVCSETCPHGQLCLEPSGEGCKYTADSDCACGCGPIYKYCANLNGGACVSPNAVC